MAIDTREKRQSVVAISFYPIGPSVTPNASKDIEWRQQAGYGYSGIAAGAPPSLFLTHFVIDITPTLNVHVISGSGVAPLIHSVLDITQVLNTQVILGSGSAPLLHNVIDITQTLNTQIISGSGSANLIHAVIDIVAILNTHVISGSGLVSLEHTALDITPILNTQVLVGTGSAQLLQSVLDITPILNTQVIFNSILTLGQNVLAIEMTLNGHDISAIVVPGKLIITNVLKNGLSMTQESIGNLNITNS